MDSNNWSDPLQAMKSWLRAASDLASEGKFEDATIALQIVSKHTDEAQSALVVESARRAALERKGE